MKYSELAEFTEKLDRAFFIDNEYKAQADIDGPLPIGYGQTISQPSLVREMTFILNPNESSKVLEIGTGSGYQTAILAEFSASVFTVEIVEPLAEKAKEKLEKLKYENVFFKIGDGSEGWLENAPYDRIIATAAAETLPIELISQLDLNGRMVIPVGPRYMQNLLLITKDSKGKVKQEIINQVRFVEFKGKYGWT
jgi:protein-L-isoaspartate(D-aspartate) O-methyltransferase